MYNSQLLSADNRYHTSSERPPHPSSGWSNEFDWDDPPFDSDVAIEDDPTAYPLSDEAAFRFLRDFILETTLYVAELEEQLAAESQDFWQAREHAYHVVTDLLIALYQFELG